MDNHSLKLPERCRPSRACSHKSTIWKEDSVSCSPSSQSSRTPSRPSKRSLTLEVWARSGCDLGALSICLAFKKSLFQY